MLKMCNYSTVLGTTDKCATSSVQLESTTQSLSEHDGLWQMEALNSVTAPGREGLLYLSLWQWS